jgi:hypothetical protein
MTQPKCVYFVTFGDEQEGFRLINQTVYRIQEDALKELEYYKGLRPIEKCLYQLQSLNNRNIFESFDEYFERCRKENNATYKKAQKMVKQGVGDTKDNKKLAVQEIVMI